ncbi:hypothetical protein [Lentzea sp. HUAS12]|uniref:hypothetical protein n=1 Tax=Lentzea sp. HUAS12 TaxID=2951806 RepID=UPI00209C7899|nr:hypothetical protein [Lentzea sp. HUAS12]USX55360.1 hypothetical protein ND450_15020 [Lentzea sp. HUAS12]
MLTAIIIKLLGVTSGAERPHVPDRTKPALARRNTTWASARTTLPEALLVTAGLVSFNLQWLNGIDVDTAIVKSGTAVAVLTFAITTPHRLLDLMRLRIVRDIAELPNAEKFL